jgi:membrane-associated protease RseP (regulator of RpoE activity)
MSSKTRLIAALSVAILAVSTAGSNAHAQQRTTAAVPPTNDQGYYEPTYTIGIEGFSQGNSVEVVRVFGGSPAQRLLLEAGDRIVSVNGQPVRSIGELQSRLSHAARYHNGQIRVLIDNVRARAGEYGAQRYVSNATYLNGFQPMNQQVIYEYQEYYRPSYSPPVVVTSGW